VLGRQSPGTPVDASLTKPNVLRRGLGVLESVIVDDHGRLFFTSQTWTRTRGGLGAVLRMDDPAADPVVLSTGITSPGGLAFDASGRLIVGFGDSPLTGLIGNYSPRAGLVTVDPDVSGEPEPWSVRLGMANGIARARDGTIFASNDMGTHIDRIAPDGQLECRWARVPSANGLAIDGQGRYLYACQTFGYTQIARVKIANPTQVECWARPGRSGMLAMLDGLAIDDGGRLYAAANGAGQIWRIDADRTITAIARGLRCPSAIALGRGTTGFSAGNVYAVTFHGDIVELPGAAA
jgi:sugar lactone lactonase YvrE